MDSDAPLGAQTSNQSASDSVRSWIASFLTYLKLRLSLLGLESKEAGLHLLVLALLFAGTVVFFAGFLVMLTVFLLYLVTLIFHWDWGWSAFACGGLLLLGSKARGVIHRCRVVKPFYPATLAELEKHREWLSEKKNKSE